MQNDIVLVEPYCKAGGCNVTISSLRDQRDVRMFLFFFFVFNVSETAGSFPSVWLFPDAFLDQC